MTLEERQSCKPYALLFGRGTIEPQGLGMMGKPLAAAAGSNWSSQAIVYDASLMGINCVGLPGGTKCVDQLNSLASKCPNSKIVVGGYSQGAMVARICVAYASEQARKQVAVSFQMRPYLITELTTWSGSCVIWRSIQWRPSQGLSPGKDQGLLRSIRWRMRWKTLNQCRPYELQLSDPWRGRY